MLRKKSNEKSSRLARASLNKLAKHSRLFTQHACRVLYSEKSRAFGQDLRLVFDMSLCFLIRRFQKVMGCIIMAAFRWIRNVMSLALSKIEFVYGKWIFLSTCLWSH